VGFIVSTLHTDETNLRFAGISGICMPNPNIVTLKVSEITALDSGSNPDQEYVYFIGSETLPSTC